MALHPRSRLNRWDKFWWWIPNSCSMMLSLNESMITYSTSPISWGSFSLFITLKTTPKVLAAFVVQAQYKNCNYDGPIRKFSSIFFKVSILKRTECYQPFLVFLSVLFSGPFSVLKNVKMTSCVYGQLFIDKVFQRNAWYNIKLVCHLVPVDGWCFLNIDILYF